MLRNRITYSASDKEELRNYITATYEGSNVAIFGVNFDLSQVKKLIINGNEVSPVQSYNFGSGGRHTIQIAMEDITVSCRSMFDTCEALVDFDLSKFDMSNVTTVEKMFYKTTKIINVTLTDLNWSKVTNAANFFGEAANLENIKFINVKSPNLDSLYFAFNWTSLRSCDMDGLDLSNVTNMQGLFKDNWSLKEWRFNTSVSKVNNVKEMFARINTIGDIYYSKKYGKGIIKKPWLWREHAV